MSSKPAGPILKLMLVQHAAHCLVCGLQLQPPCQLANTATLCWTGFPNVEEVQLFHQTAHDMAQYIEAAKYLFHLTLGIVLSVEGVVLVFASCHIRSEDMTASNRQSCPVRVLAALPHDLTWRTVPAFEGNLTGSCHISAPAQVLAAQLGMRLSCSHSLFVDCHVLF